MEEIDFENENRPTLPKPWQPEEWQGRTHSDISWQTTLSAATGMLLLIVSAWIYFTK